MLGLDPPAKTIEVEPGREELLEWTAPVSAVLSGRATARGKPLGQGVLTLLRRGADGGGPWYPVRAKTDSSGGFAFPPVPIGNYAVARGDYAIHFDVAALVYAAGTSVEIPVEWGARLRFLGLDANNERKVELHDGENSADLDFGDANHLEVAVVDAQTQQSVPRADVRVYAPLGANATIPRGHARRFPENEVTGKPTFDRRGRAGVDGKVGFDDIPDGRYRVSVHAPGRRRAQVDVDVAGGEPRVVVAIERGSALRGKVVNADGSAAASAVVTLVPSGDDLEPILLDSTVFDTAPNTPQAFVRDDGSFELAGLPPGNQRFLVFSSVHAPMTVDFTIPETGALDDAVITVEKFGGFVVSAHRGADPIPNFTVKPTREDGAAAFPPEAWESDLFFGLVGGMGDPVGSGGGAAPNGVRTLERIRPGTYTLEITEAAEEGATAKPAVTVKARAVAGRSVPVYVELP
jgi:hypothetical protein